ncbi:hypothetical protein BV210_03380 [Halorientalis sp. IM1011]|uniref:hypothetical protein n=1 Tax=Halorientalis sp. IM1011 TaxID=1932360 RepID=UPI00097CD4FD|nr:hypothetical protein [Halorientalis sp. IM1011]AQL41814.1 hypothetical protein BV210_03380 [Halorientalis sp. IM1011]
MGSITLFTTSEYEPQAFDAVLFRETLVVCVQADEESVRLVPLDKVNHVDGDADDVLVDTEIPESFYGGAEYGLADVEAFPDLQTHLEDLEGEEY